MKHISKILAALIVCVPMVCGVAHAAKVGGIKGKVIDTLNGKPVAGVTVVATTETNIESEMKYARVITKTGKDGSFVINGIRNKRYVINVSKPGYFRYGTDAAAVEEVPNESNKVIREPIPISSGINSMTIKPEYILDNGTDVMWSKRVLFRSAEDQEAEDFVASLNASKYAGYADWRLPRGQEAGSLCYKLMTFARTYQPGRYINVIYPQNVFGMLTTGESQGGWHGVRTLDGLYVMQQDSACNGVRNSAWTKAVWPVRGGAPFAQPGEGGDEDDDEEADDENVDDSEPS